MLNVSGADYTEPTGELSYYNITGEQYIEINLESVSKSRSDFPIYSNLSDKTVILDFELSTDSNTSSKTIIRVLSSDNEGNDLVMAGIQTDKGGSAMKFRAYSNYTNTTASKYAFPFGSGWNRITIISTVEYSSGNLNISMYYNGGSSSTISYTIRPDMLDNMKMYYGPKFKFSSYDSANFNYRKIYYREGKFAVPNGRDVGDFTEPI